MGNGLGGVDDAVRSGPAVGRPIRAILRAVVVLVATTWWAASAFASAASVNPACHRLELEET